MKTLIIVLLLSTPVLCQNKMSQETYDGLVARQYKSIPVYDGPKFFITQQRKDISTAGWDWPNNSTYNQYYLSQYYRGTFSYDLFDSWRQIGSRDLGKKSNVSKNRMVLPRGRR